MFQTNGQRAQVPAFALPDNHNTPAQRLKRGHAFGIPRPVAVDFGSPVPLIRLRQPNATMAVVSMPEAPMDKQGEATADKGDVWLAGQIFAVQPIPPVAQIAA